MATGAVCEEGYARLRGNFSNWRVPSASAAQTDGSRAFRPEPAHPCDSARLPFLLRSEKSVRRTSRLENLNGAW